MLLEHGADVNAATHHPDIIAAIKAEFEAGRDRLVKALWNAPTACAGATALMFASYHRANAELVGILLDRGADANARSGTGQTALMLAAQRGDTSGMAALLARGADAKVAAPTGETALSETLDRLLPRLDAAKLLVEHGADVNQTGPSGRTLLMGAAVNGKLDIVRFLLACGAKVNAKDNNGLGARAYAFKGGETEVTRVLQEAGSDPFSLNESAYLDDASEVKRLLDGGAPVEGVSRLQDTPLMVAAGWGRLKAAKLLLGSGASVNARNKAGWTALMKAVDGMRPLTPELPCIVGPGVASFEIATALLERGAEVNAKASDRGWTALMIAAENGCGDMVRLLLSHSALVNEKDNSGDTALANALRRGHAGVAAMLVQAAAAKP